MIDKFDYAEPHCATCGGKEFYYPKKDAPIGRIPVGRIIEKVDACFDKNDYQEAGRLLEFWKDEAIALKDKNGELAMHSELIGFYRKQNVKDKALNSVAMALLLIEELEQSKMTSGATVLINCATAYKAFDMEKDAIVLYEKAEQIYKNTLDENDSKFGGLYNNMALTLCALGEYDRAESAYLKALCVMGKVEHGELEQAITYINLAHLFESNGKQEKIKECMQKALTLLKSDNVIRNGHCAFIYEKCAPSFGYFGDEKTYEMLLKESKEIYERA